VKITMFQSLSNQTNLSKYSSLREPLT
jgi:hypothetical protein